MKGKAAGVAAFAVLFAAQAWLRPEPAPSPGEPVESAITVLAGALRPLFVAITWVEAEAALDDHRLLDALDRLRLLETADPGAWEASLFRAHLIAHNLADREPSEARAARIAEAVAILDAAARRTTDPGPAVAKGQLLLEARMWDPDLSERLEKTLGATPRAAALAAFAEAEARAPGSDKIKRLAMEASRLRGIELLARDAPIAEALPHFDQAAALAKGVREDILARKLSEGWAAAVRAAAGSDPEAIAAGQERLVAALRDWAAIAPPTDGSEAVFAGSLARAAMAAAEKRAQAGDSRAALSLLRLVHTIRSFVFSRLDRSRLSSTRAFPDRRRALSLLSEISAKSPDLAIPISDLRKLISAW